MAHLHEKLGVTAWIANPMLGQKGTGIRNTKDLIHFGRRERLSKLTASHGASDTTNRPSFVHL